MLEWLERNNLFLVPLDDEGRYYRYHHLFAAFLRERLGREIPTKSRDSTAAPGSGKRQMGVYPGLSSTPWPRRTSTGRRT